MQNDVIYLQLNNARVSLAKYKQTNKQKWSEIIALKKFRFRLQSIFEFATS
jgi:hypothetical protein